MLGLIIGLFNCGGTPTVTVAQLGAIQLAIQEVSKALSSAIAQADDATKNRINQADTKAKENIQRLDKLIKDGMNSAAVQREEAARQGFEFLSQTQKMVDESGKSVFSEVNRSLAGSCAALDAIPFLKIADTVFAVQPYRMRADARDREISVYGYFPSIADDADAVAVEIDGSPVKVKRSVGKIFFDMPEEVLKKRKALIDMRIQLPKKGWLASKPTPIIARLHVVKNSPYSFTIEANKDNTGAFETMKGAAHKESSNDGNRNVHLQAETLFNTSVGNQRYEAATAQIVEVKQHFGSGKPCEDCPEPTGSVSAWNANGIDIALNAPKCPIHMVDKTCEKSILGAKIYYPCPYKCDGGGSNADLTVVPSFTVRVKGAPENIPIASHGLTAGWKAVVSHDLPQDWSNVVVRAVFDDNFDHVENMVVVKKAIPIAAADSFSVRVENNRLFISTN
jgi:predicted metal-binding protein